ncbi:MAG: phosphonoacetaldehyde hydrolase [Desulfamplus sp.]|nr:phosphonoacetaldehyde hydrolase [Desulfamplus sp.]
MQNYTNNNRSDNKMVKAVVLDWAGTAVDYGCIGPVAVFIESFKKHGVEVTAAEARMFMGLMKRDHIRSMCNLPSVKKQWIERYGKEPDENDVDAIYKDTEPMMVSAVAGYSDLIYGLLDFVDGLRKKDIKIGSSTGYTGSMMEVLAQQASKKGYVPDSIVCSTDVPAGRPYPWMCYMNAINLNVYPMWCMVKIGDTISDIEEGLNAGMWTVGLTKSGNELGLTENEVTKLNSVELENRLNEIKQRFINAGAHYIVEGIWDCMPIIELINSRIFSGEIPTLRQQ